MMSLHLSLMGNFSVHEKPCNVERVVYSLVVPVSQCDITSSRLSLDMGKIRNLYWEISLAKVRV